MWFLIFAVIIIISLVIHYKNIEVDMTLKYCELFGKKVEVLRGQVVWITGASSGLGEYLAYELASAGCKLVLSARRQQELERVKAKCCEIAGLKQNDFDKDKDIFVLPLDLCKFDTHKEAVKTVLGHFNQVDILVNNSGKSQRSVSIETELEVDQELFELNVIGTISLTKAVLPHMVEKKTGQIVVVSSIAGKMGLPMMVTYSATKFAIQGYFYGLRSEIYDDGINVSLVCPGPIKSAIIDNAVTEKLNQSVKDKGTEEDKSSGRMETDTFARWMAIAVANKLDECWISPNPALWMAYVSQYTPDFFNWFFTPRLFKKAKARSAGVSEEKKKS